MNTYIFKSDYGTYDVNIIIDHYKLDGSLAIELIDAHDGSPLTSLTICLTDDLGLPYFCVGSNRAFVDTNNVPEAEAFIREYKLGKFTGIKKPSGFCTYPLYEFDLDRLTK